MTLNIQLPISYVRSTNEKISLVERRRRPDFLLSLTLDTTHAPRATHSPSTAPSEISPSLCPSLSPGITASSPCTPYFEPSTPVDDLKPEWMHQNAKNSIDLSSTFDHVACSNASTPTDVTTTAGNASELDNPNANLAHFGPLLERCHTSPMLTDPPANAERESRSPPAVQRVLRRRSGRSHNHDLVISNPLSTHYRALSEKERRALKLDVHRRHYKCLIDGCDRLFARKSNVENHVRTHLDDKPFVCSEDTCKAAFVRKGDLQRHEQIHRPSRSHMCSCGQTFSRNDALMKHIRKGICGPNGSSV